MASIKIIWSPQAQKSYIRISDFILAKWSKKEVKTFAERTSSTILKIARNPELFVASKQKRISEKGSLPNKPVYYTG